MAGDNSIDPAARRVVNKNTGITNILDVETSNEQIVKTLDRCADILRDHCGPQSGYAMILDEAMRGAFNPTLFTRDGINILSAVEFMSPMECYIQDMLTYIGSRVDNIAKDGTTTSMLFSALFLRNLMAERQRIRELNLSFFQMRRLVDKLFSDILADLESTYVLDVKAVASITNMDNEDLDELTEEETMASAGKIAFMQAMSSSGGNLDLAIAMKEIFEKSPSVAWEFIESKTSKQSTGRSFQVEVDPHDARIRCINGTANNIFNHGLGTEYREENVRIIAIPGCLEDGSFVAEEVEDLIKSLPPDQAVAIISMRISARLLTEIMALNSTREKPITVWNYSPEQQIAGQAYPWELMALAAIGCVEPPLFIKNNDPVTIANTFVAKEIHWHDTYLDFFGIVDMGENSCLHPFYAHPEKATAFYTETVADVTKKLDDYRNGHCPDGTLFGFFQEVLNRLVCVHRPTLRLGGPALDQYANQEVVKDVQGAIMSSLTSGFLINGSIGLRNVVMDCLNDITGDTENEIEFQGIVLEQMYSSLMSVLDTIFTLPGKHSCDFLTVDGLVAMHEHPGLYQNVLAESPKPQSFTEYLVAIGTNIQAEASYNTSQMTRTYPVMQPITITRELLKRAQELIMKFINVNKIVVKGGVVLEDADTNKE